MSTLQVVPAYGRDYKSAKAVRADIDAEKDFIIADYSNRWDGKPANREDFVSGGVTVLLVRYNNMRSVARVEL